MILSSKTLYSFVGIFVSVCILFAIFSFSYSNEVNTKTPLTEPIEIKFDDIIFSTSTNPKYKIIIYTDLDCIHCKETHQLLEERKNNLNHMDIYIRNIAFIVGGKSSVKTLYGQCVNRISGNNVWLEYESLAYKSFEIKDNEHFKNIALSLVAKKNKEFIECIKSEKEINLVKSKRMDAIVKGVQYIPTIYINDNNSMIKKIDTYNAKSIIKYLEYINNKE